jgi:uncharacterized protein (DUF2235 family)
MTMNETATQGPGIKRQLIVLCDGTSNAVDMGQGTNVFRTLSALPANDPKQVVFYDPGVGSASYAPETTWVDKGRQLKDRFMGLAFGNGVFENIAQAYEFLVREYQEGDEIYVFGFSRGAFTARAVVGMVNAFGLLPVHSNNLLPMLLNVYFTENDLAIQLSQTELQKPPKRTRQVLIDKVRANNIPENRRDITVQFVGVWDTVATLGIPPLDRQISVVAKMTDAHGQPKKFRHVRQALALDEQRVMFKPRQYQDADIALDRADANKQSLMQRWFPGSHCDVGGTYWDNFGISESAIKWLLEEARQCGLRIDIERLQAIATPVNGGIQQWPLIHSELYDTPYWAAAGMCVREARYGAAFEMPALKYPQDTVWKDRRSGKLWLLAAFFCALFFWASGWAALGLGREQLLDVRAWQDALFAPMRIALWQLQAVVGDCNPIYFAGNAHLKTALVWDTLMISAYAYIAGRLISRCFANLAGLNALQAKPRRMLNFLGLGLMALVLGDLLENIATFVWLAWPVGAWPILLGTTAVLVTLFSLAKLLGLGMCLALALWAAWHRLFATEK